MAHVTRHHSSKTLGDAISRATFHKWAGSRTWHRVRVGEIRYKWCRSGFFFFGGNRKQSIYLCNYFSAARLARRGGEAARAGRKEVYVFPPFRVVFVKYKQRQVKRPRIAPAFQTTTTSLLLVSARCYFLHRKDAPSP